MRGVRALVQIRAVTGRERVAVPDDWKLIPGSPAPARVTPRSRRQTAVREEARVAMDRREQIVETVVESVPTQTVEERVVDQDGAVRRVVRSVGEAAPPLVATTVVTHPPAVRRTVSRFWRRSSVPVAAATTEYAVVGDYGG